MVRKIFYGEANALTANAKDISLNEKLALGVIVILICWMGVYPKPMLDLTNDISDSILKISDVHHLLKK
jgi:NADH-quinone oxidoreductase subunit M